MKKGQANFERLPFSMKNQKRSNYERLKGL
jgi:hypothetical protein